MPLLIVVDNFFNLFTLIDQCSLKNLPILGILRIDHLKEATIYSKKELMKEDKLYFEVAHSAIKNSEKAVVARKYNGAVLMASYCSNYPPLFFTKRGFDFL